MVAAKIWKYFSIVVVKGENKRKCLKCGKILDHPIDKSTSNMIRHLTSPGHEEENQSYKSGEDNNGKVYQLRLQQIFLMNKKQI
jgi:hypothetical protein